MVYGYEITHEKLSWEENFFSITLTWPMYVAISDYRSYCKAAIDLSICKAPVFVGFYVYFHKDSSIPCSFIFLERIFVLSIENLSHSFKQTLP